MNSELKAGDVVLFKKGEHYELGIVKRKCEDGGYFVWYNIGDTAAKTRAEDLREIYNSYAFKVERKKEVQEDTNREWLEKMSNAELAEWLNYDSPRVDSMGDTTIWEEWLAKPVKTKVKASGMV